MGQLLLRRLRKLPLRAIGSALLVVGIALVAFNRSRGGLVSQVATLVPSPERIPTPSLPVPAHEKTLVPTYTPAPDDKPLATTPTTQLTETPSIPEPTVEVVERAPPATRLVIPTLGIDAPVVEVPITNKTWDVSGLTHEIAHLGGTANPGEKNNMVLAGHVTLKRGAGPFLHVESLEPGDMAIVYAGEQAYTYRVVTTRYIGPTDVSIAYPTSDPILTLVSCTNWDAENRVYLQRVAVIAELVEEESP